MKQLILHQDDFVGGWVCQRTGGTWEGRGVAIGQGLNGKLIAGVLLDNYNGVSCSIHVASDGSKTWLDREFLRVVFALPFLQWKLRSVLSPIGEDNIASQRFCAKLGFSLKATLEDAHPSGKLYLFQMKRDECRWLNLKIRNRHHGWKEQCPAGT